MKLGTMLGDVARSLVRKPVTEMYPFERREAPVQFRGRVKWDLEKCTGCGLCTRECPSNALELFVIDRKAKQFVMRYHVDRCTFCAQCVFSCRFDALAMSHDVWEMAATSRDGFTLTWGREEHVRQILEGTAEPDAEAVPG